TRRLPTRHEQVRPDVREVPAEEPRIVQQRGVYLLDILASIGPPIQAVPATDDRAVALHWYEVLQEQGIEGVVAKKGSAAYPSGRRGFIKIRHADTEDALVVGYAGPPRRPHRLALLVGAALASAFVRGKRRAQGETYHHVETDVMVEVLAGSGRHGILTVIRVR
ncbi:hypothetical protein ACIQGX_38105, partial [Streptomyces sp. NPDC092903]